MSQYPYSAIRPVAHNTQSFCWMMDNDCAGKCNYIIVQSNRWFGVLTQRC